MLVRSALSCCNPGRPARYGPCEPEKGVSLRPEVYRRGVVRIAPTSLGAFGSLVCCRERNDRMSHGVGGDAPANVQKYLKGVDYPAKKQELVDQAKKNGAPQEVVQVIQQFPNKEFDGPQDVMKAYG